MHEDMQTFIMVWTEIDLERGGKVSICLLGGFWNDTKTLTMVGWMSNGVLIPFTRLQGQTNLVSC
jgi:hypothetical protein